MSLDTAALQQKIRAGLDRLYNFQHEDGGWGWWETDESHPFMTAYVVAGLAQAKAAGVQVDDDAHRERRAVDRQSIRRRSASWPPICAPTCSTRWRWRASPTPTALGQVFEQRAKLSPYGLALLGLALELVKDARAGEIAARARAGGAAGRGAGVVAGDARPDARFLRGRHARGHGVRGEVPLAPAARIPRCCRRRRSG